MPKEYTKRLNQERQAEICHAINVELIVREAHLSPMFNGERFCQRYGFLRQDLSAAVSKSYGTNFSSLLQRYRVNKACEMLASRDFDYLSCEIIGLRCGFSSRQSFYNAFGRVMKTTPLAYREQYQHKQNK